MNKQPRIWFNRQRPPTLSIRFLIYLQEEGVKEFTTKMTYQWYQQNKMGSRHADYSAIYPLILNPLRYQGFIKRAFQGSWMVIAELDSSQINETETVSSTTDEDREFFDYIDSKLKGERG